MNPAGKNVTQSTIGAHREIPLPDGTVPLLNCPRCDSPDTKFCYYNNYSLTQPRHFCKTCRRYWTRGGTLRNIPVGGGCRQRISKKIMKPSPRCLSGGSEYNVSYHSGPSSSDFGGVRFFQLGAMDFQVDCPFNQCSYWSNSLNICDPLSSNPSFSLDPLVGFRLFRDSGIKPQSELQEMGPMNLHTSNLTVESSAPINRRPGKSSSNVANEVEFKNGVIN